LGQKTSVLGVGDEELKRLDMMFN